MGGWGVRGGGGGVRGWGGGGEGLGVGEMIDTSNRLFWKVELSSFCPPPPPHTHTLPLQIHFV